MSYTRVRAMRSNRYPLMGARGMGCGCAMHGVGDDSSTFGQAIRRRLAPFFPSSTQETGGSEPGVIADDGMDTAVTVGIVGIGVVGLAGLGWWLLKRRRAAAS